jgi:hypothetical protein
VVLVFKLYSFTAVRSNMAVIICFLVPGSIPLPDAKRATGMVVMYDVDDIWRRDGEWV